MAVDADRYKHDLNIAHENLWNTHTSRTGINPKTGELHNASQSLFGEGGEQQPQQQIPIRDIQLGDSYAQQQLLNQPRSPMSGGSDTYVNYLLQGTTPPEKGSPPSRTQGTYLPKSMPTQHVKAPKLNWRSKIRQAVGLDPVETPFVN
jgi:hypothetical protein